MFVENVVDFVRNKSIHGKLLGILKHVGSLLRALKLLVMQKPFKQYSQNSEFKSVVIRILS